MELVREKEMWDSEEERIFLEALWGTLRSLYRQEADAVRRGGTRSAADRLTHLDDEIFRRLMRSKTRDLLRETLAELFAKAGRQETIRSHPAAVWNLMNHPHDWKRARDLALLALATYSKRQEHPNSESPVDTKGDVA